MTRFSRPASALLLLSGLLMVALGIACTGAKADPAPTPTPTTAVVSPSPAPSATAASSRTAVPSASPTAVAPTPAPATSGPTGVKNVDRAIGAVLNRDAFQLASLFHLEAKGCTTAVGLGGPPQCRAGEAPGTTVHVLYTSSCDGHYLRQEEVASLAERFVEDKGKLAGVYEHNGLLFPSSQYVVVFSFDTPYGSLARILFVSDPGIVGVTFACGTSAKEYVDTLGLRTPVYLPGG